jgi:hypothetical protein
MILGMTVGTLLLVYNSVNRFGGACYRATGAGMSWALKRGSISSRIANS